MCGDCDLSVENRKNEFRNQFLFLNFSHTKNCNDTELNNRYKVSEIFYIKISIIILYVKVTYKNLKAIITIYSPGRAF